LCQPRQLRPRSVEYSAQHQELCDRDQAFFLKAIPEDLDLSDWMNDAVNPLRIVLAPDESIRTRRAVEV
jgi:hypothetical protein